MNEAALHQIVQQRNQAMNRCLARCFSLEIAVGLVCFAAILAYAGVLAFGDPGWLITPRGRSVAPTRWHILLLLIAAGIWFYYSAYMYRARKRQQRQVEVFDSTLRGDLDRALSQTDFQITMLKKIVWRGLAPVWVASAIWMVVLFHLKNAPTWIYPFMIAIALASLVGVIASKQRSIASKYLPRRRELAALRSKLAEPEASGHEQT
jgi:H+/Cl- antiporter ClcA